MLSFALFCPVWCVSVFCPVCVVCCVRGVFDVVQCVFVRAADHDHK